MQQLRKIHRYIHIQSSVIFHEIPHFLQKHINAPVLPRLEQTPHTGAP